MTLQQQGGLGLPGSDNEECFDHVSCLLFKTMILKATDVARMGSGESSMFMDGGWV
jgi:hypothetical protein